MYNSSSSYNYNDQQGYSYLPYKQCSPGGSHFPSHPPSGYSSSQPPSGYPWQPTSHQPYSSPDPRLTAQQTNEALTALASARRSSFPPEYIWDSPSHPPSTHDPNLKHHSLLYNDASHPRHTASNGGSLDPYAMRPGHVYSTMAPPAQMSNTSSRTSDGHACNYCGKAFGRPSALKIHLAIHTGEKAYICPEAGCHRSFSVRSNMSRHIRNVHQIWPDGHGETHDSGDDAE